MPNSLNSTNRTENLEHASSLYFDVIVIGGGITGSGIALDAASRGMKVLLLEKQDFAAGTSSRSTKLIHGGLRYLKQLEFRLVQQVGRERATLYQNAPYLVYPEKLLLPIYKSGSLGFASTSLALWFYDLLAGVQKKEKRIMLSRQKAMHEESMLSEDGLLGAGLYYEYRTDDARLTMEVLKTAVNYGARAFNYLELNDFVETNGQISGVQTTDLIQNTSYEFRAKYVVNATGPWVDKLRKKNAESLDKHLYITKGVHLVFSQEKFPIKHSMYFDVPDGRMVFAVKRDGKVYLGTTDTEYHDSLEKPICTKKDMDYLLNAANAMFSKLNLISKDVESSWAGLRPLIHEKGKSPSEVSRKDEVFEANNGLISIAGGKLTAFRKMAQKIVDRIEKNEKRFGECKTASILLAGTSSKGGHAYESMRNRLKKYETKFNSDKYLVKLLHTYGEACFTMLDNSEDSMSLVFSEIDYCIENESLEHLADYYARRSGKVLFDIDEMKDRQDVILEYYAKKRNLTEDEVQIEKAMVEQIKNEALVKP
ncbi:MAG: glycerol-3-phosphate dehydrogenase/oxidase [Flavobacteriales bacterium]|jgi:glycerol-3-phosphate dehydrogenase|tara:strand:+ start:1199 stop:2812 length:1614 start_codon:yes stop_codon:yes gene_type:complete